MMLEIEHLLTQTLGLNVESIGSAAIRRSVEARMTRRGIRRIEEYQACVARDSHELQALIEQVVVPETWFFRNAEALTALSELITTEWLPAHRGQMLRVLSVPCSTGEEPYSIAITLAEMGMAREHVHIDAIDVSSRSLAFAARGTYGSNSFRTPPLQAHQRYFHRGPTGATLSPAIREWVHFSQGNLVSDGFRAPAPSYDIVFCRNVLIYFERGVQGHVVDTLSGLLDSEGYLFVGPAEAMLATERGFCSAGYRMAFAFRRPRPSPVEQGSRTLPAVPPRGRRKATASVSRWDLPKEAAPRLRAVSRIPMVVPPDVTSDNALVVARRLADEGKLVEAAQICEAYVRVHETSSAAWYLFGLVLDATGASERATQLYRRAVFLDPNHAEAAMHLDILRRQGRAENAARADR
jgi:chemotaxis protein methyltransferase WspC